MTETQRFVSWGDNVKEGPRGEQRPHSPSFQRQGGETLRHPGCGDAHEGQVRHSVLERNAAAQ